MPTARTIIDGTPGERYHNATARPMYQLIVAQVRTCGICYQYMNQVARFWPIPIHPGCRCKQVAIQPLATAPHPFVNYREVVAKLSLPDQANVMGRSCFVLWRKGVVTWGDVVTSSRIRTLEEVVARKKLSVERMVEVGVQPGFAERAHAAVHTSEHEAAEAHRKRLIDQIAKAGVAHDKVVRHLAQSLVGRVTLEASQASYMTRAGVVLTGNKRQTILPGAMPQDFADAMFDRLLAQTLATGSPVGARKKKGKDDGRDEQR
jgi:hypothetical protein